MQDQEVAAAAFHQRPDVRAAAATDHDLAIAAVDYRPAAWDPAIPEHERKDQKNWSFGNPDLGGLLTIVVRNDGATDAGVDDVTVDGVPLADLLAATCQDAGLACTASPPREMAWARWLPGPSIPAGGAAVFQLKRTTEPAASTTIGIEVDGRPALTANVVLDPSPIRLGLAYRDGWLYCSQRGEVTRMRDTDGDGRADEFRTYADAWGLSGERVGLCPLMKWTNGNQWE